MNYKTVITFLFTLFAFAHLQAQDVEFTDTVPLKEVTTNQQIIDTVIHYGSHISSTYKKAVCTELVIKIIDKFYTLNKQNKSRIRIITNSDVHKLLENDSPIPKGVYYALSEKGIGTPVDELEDVMPGDFVQFWTSTWGHCGIVKQVNANDKTMELYSSFPSTDGYGIQKFPITDYCYFIRLK